jgi:hypothetical protein
MSVIYIDSYRFGVSGPTDPYFSNVSLLLHGDGTNGSTTIVDSSASPKTLTAFGNAQISTAQSKFGGSSIAFDGTGDYLSISSSNDLTLGTSDFTLETWARLATVSAQHNQIITTGDPEIATGFSFSLTLDLMALRTVSIATSTCLLTLGHI